MQYDESITCREVTATEAERVGIGCVAEGFLCCRKRFVFLSLRLGVCDH